MYRSHLPNLLESLHTDRVQYLLVLHITSQLIASLDHYAKILKGNNNKIIPICKDMA